MTSITIDFTKSPIEISDTVLGHKGEKNATQLIITPPTEMSAPDSGIVYYCVAFQIGAHRVSHSALYEKAETITVPLERSVTQVNVLSLQLEGYDEEENVIIKSDRIDNLTFNPSVDGEEYDGSGSSHNLGAEVSAIKNRVYNLEKKERETFIVELNSDEYYIASGSCNNFCLVDATDTLENRDEIKSIEIFYLNEWIDLRNAIRFDGAPVIINMFKVTNETNSNTGEMVMAFIYYPESTGIIFDLLCENRIDKLRVTVYKR